jgi:hypothetical protein
LKPPTRHRYGGPSFNGSINGLVIISGKIITGNHAPVNYGRFLYFFPSSQIECKDMIDPFQRSYEPTHLRNHGGCRGIYTCLIWDEKKSTINKGTIKYLIVKLCSTDYGGFNSSTDGGNMD